MPSAEIRMKVLKVLDRGGQRVLVAFGWLLLWATRSGAGEERHCLFPVDAVHLILKYNHADSISTTSVPCFSVKEKQKS